MREAAGSRLDYDFGLRTATKIQMSRRMHIVAAKRRNKNEIGPVFGDRGPVSFSRAPVCGPR
jgi:hypothetical protein